MRRFVFKWFSILAIAIIRLLFWAGSLIASVFKCLGNLGRFAVLRWRYPQDEQLIKSAILPRINKRLDHVAVWWMQQFDDNPQTFTNKLWFLIEWLMMWEVSMWTIYFDRIRDSDTSEIRDLMQNTLNKYFNDNKLWWKNMVTSSFDSHQDSEETDDGM